MLTKGRSSRALLPHLLASIGYVHNLVWKQGSSIHGVAWSLEVEVQFYLLAPLLARVYRVASPALRRGILVGASAAMVGLQYVPVDRLAVPRLALSLFNFLHYFLLGMLAADLYTTASRAPRRAWDALALVACVAFVPRVRKGISARAVPPVLFAVLLVAAWRGVYLRRALTRRAAVLIGGMCYSIYLFHSLAIALTLRITARWVVGPYYALNFALQLAAVSAPVLLVGAAYFRWVERPFMRWQPVPGW